VAWSIDLAELRARLWDDRAFYGLIAAYGLALLILSLALRDSQKFVPLVYATLSLRTGTEAVCGAGLLAFVIARLTGTTDALVARAAAVATPRRLAGLLLLVALLVFHGLFTSAKTMLAEVAPFTHDRELARFDALLHAGDPWRAWVWLTPLLPSLQVIYAVGWGLALVASMGFACLEAPDPLRRQFLWSFLLSWIVLGNVVAGLMMSGGPVFYEDLLGDPRFHQLTANLDRAGIGGWLDCRAMLWRAYIHHSAGVGTGISAFPSLHVSMATLFTLFWWRLDRRLGASAAVFALVTFVSSILLGWHYAVDGYAAALGTVAIWWAAGRAVATHQKATASLQERKLLV
jgi:hypothetical protein